MRGRSKKFDAHSLPAFSGLADKHDAAFQFFLGLRMDQQQELAPSNLMSQQQQPAVRAHDLGLADFTEFSSIMPAALGLHAGFVKDTLAAADAGL